MVTVPVGPYRRNIQLLMMLAAREVDAAWIDGVSETKILICITLETNRARGE